MLRSDRQQSTARRFLAVAKALQWLQALQLLGAALAAAVVGDIGYQVLTGELPGWSWPERAWRALLMLGAYLGAVGLIPAIGRIFGKEERELNVGEDLDITPTPALIVIASAPDDPKTGPHRTAVDNFVKNDAKVLTHLFIIHSDDEKCLNSTANLTTFAEGKGVTVRTNDLEADYDDPKSMYEVARKAIALAIAEVDQPERVTLDVTGGSKMASVGAAMAKVDHDQVWMGYIPNVWSEELKRSVPGKVMKQIDVSWVPIRTTGVLSNDADYAQDASTKRE